MAPRVGGSSWNFISTGKTDGITELTEKEKKIQRDTLKLLRNMPKPPKATFRSVPEAVRRNASPVAA